MSKIKRKAAIELVVIYYTKEITDAINTGSVMLLKDIIMRGHYGVVNKGNDELTKILKENTSIDYTIIDDEIREPHM